MLPRGPRERMLLPRLLQAGVLGQERGGRLRFVVLHVGANHRRDTREFHFTSCLCHPGGVGFLPLPDRDHLGRDRLQLPGLLPRAQRPRRARRRDEGALRRPSAGRVRRRASYGQDVACRAAAGPAARRLPAHSRAATPPGRRCGHRHRRAGAGRRVPRGERRSVVVVLTAPSSFKKLQPQFTVTEDIDSDSGGNGSDLSSSSGSSSSGDSSSSDDEEEAPKTPPPAPPPAKIPRKKRAAESEKGSKKKKKKSKKSDDLDSIFR